MREWCAVSDRFFFVEVPIAWRADTGLRRGADGRWFFDDTKIIVDGYSPCWPSDSG